MFSQSKVTIKWLKFHEKPVRKMVNNAWSPWKFTVHNQRLPIEMDELKLPYELCQAQQLRLPNHSLRLSASKWHWWSKNKRHHWKEWQGHVDIEKNSLCGWRRSSVNESQVDAKTSFHPPPLRRVRDGVSLMRLRWWWFLCRIWNDKRNWVIHRY